MYQTRQLRAIVDSATQCHCCGKLEIFCPNLLNEELEHIVQFLYNGEIACLNQEIANQTFDNLTKVFGFPFTNWSNNCEPLSQVPFLPVKVKIESNDVLEMNADMEARLEAEEYDSNQFYFNDYQSDFPMKDGKFIISNDIF